MGFEVRVPQNPQRIISLVPSQTELLFDLGLEDRIVGVTKFCIHPQDIVKKYPKVGGTKKFNFEIIKALNPDLIIGNKEENYQEGIETLKKEYAVWMSDIVTLEDSLSMMNAVGELTDSENIADSFVKNIKESFEKQKNVAPKKALYFIWKTPHMVIGKGTFIDEMLPYAGFDNVIKETRYPQLSEQQIIDYGPEYILLSSEPFPFKEKHINAFKKLCPDAKVILVDGEMFSWYGSRLKNAPVYFRSLLRENASL